MFIQIKLLILILLLLKKENYLHATIDIENNENTGDDDYDNEQNVIDYDSEEMAEDVNNNDEEQMDNLKRNNDNNNKMKKDDYVGTILFGNRGYMKKCFTQEDIALLSTRKEFENLIPICREKHLEDDRSIEILIQYFYGANEIVQKMTSGDIKYYAERALYDAIGGYLNHYLLPVTKYSFYAGNITYKTTQYVYDLYEHVKEFLNTDGIGWRAPIDDFSNFHCIIEPLIIIQDDEGAEEKNEQTPCSNLLLLDDNSETDEEMLVALPKLETEENGYISNIWIPFKRKHNFNVYSKSSAFILMRYYVTVTKCYNFEGLSQTLFNKKFSAWINENIMPYIKDIKFYPGFGAILRILETLRIAQKEKGQTNEEAVEETIVPKTQQANMAKSDELMKLQKQIEHVKAPEEQNMFEKLISPAMGIGKTDEEMTDEEIKMRWIKITILLSLLILLLIIIIALICKLMNYLTKRRESKKPDTANLKKPSKFSAICPFWHRKKKDKNSEVINLHSSSSAIMSNNEKQSNSTIGAPRKCSPCSRSCCSNAKKDNSNSSTNKPKRRSRLKCSPCPSHSSCCKKSGTSIRNPQNKRIYKSDSSTSLSAPNDVALKKPASPKQSKSNVKRATNVLNMKEHGVKFEDKPKGALKKPKTENDKGFWKTHRPLLRRSKTTIEEPKDGKGLPRSHSVDADKDAGRGKVMSPRLRRNTPCTWCTKKTRNSSSSWETIDNTSHTKLHK